MTQEPTLTDRLASLWDHLGLRTAHVGAQIPADLSGFVSRHPERIASLLLCEAPGIDPAPLAAVAARTTLVAGDAGLSGQVADAAAPQLPGCRRVALPGYGEPLWADSVSRKTEAIVSALRDLPGEASAPAPPWCCCRSSSPPRSGTPPSRNWCGTTPSSCWAGAT